MSPIVAGIFAALLFVITRFFVLDHNFVSRAISPYSFIRALYFAPFFFALVAGLLVVLLAYKIPANSNAAGSGSNYNVNSGQSSNVASLANDPDGLAKAAGITALVFAAISAVYVSYYQYRYNWKGEDIKYHEVRQRRARREGPPADPEDQVRLRHGELVHGA